MQSDNSFRQLSLATFFANALSTICKCIDHVLTPSNIAFHHVVNDAFFGQCVAQFRVREVLRKGLFKELLQYVSCYVPNVLHQRIRWFCIVLVCVAFALVTAAVSVAEATNAINKPYTVQVTEAVASNTMRFSDCRKIVDDKQRLVCFDAVTMVCRDSDLGMSSRAAPQSLTHSALEQTHSRGVTHSGANPIARSPAKQFEAVQTEISDVVKSGSDRRAIYLLANGQRWQQTSPERRSIRSGDRVLIKKTLLGRYVLSNADGARTLVQPLRSSH